MLLTRDYLDSHLEAWAWRAVGTVLGGVAVMLFEAFAAVVIGGVSLRGGVGRLSGVIAGVLLLSTIDTAINVMGLEASYMQVIRGGLMLVAVLLDSVKTSVEARYA